MMSTSTVSILSGNRSFNRSTSLVGFGTICLVLALGIVVVFGSFVVLASSTLATTRLAVLLITTLAIGLAIDVSACHWIPHRLLVSTRPFGIRVGNRQNRGGKNQSNGSKPDKGGASVEASVPAKN